MKRIFALASLALVTAGVGFFLPWRSNETTERSLASSPAPNVSAPTAAKAKAAVTATMDDPKQRLAATKACLASEDCDYPKTDPRSYNFAVGRALARQLAEIHMLYANDPGHETELAALAREYIRVEDEFVQEEAIKIFSALPPSRENMEAMTNAIANTPDPDLTEQAMKEMERYLGTAEEARVLDFLAEFIANGAQFSAEKASELIWAFINERSFSTFQAALAKMEPESTAARHLRAALNEFRRQQSGA